MCVCVYRFSSICIRVCLLILVYPYIYTYAFVWESILFYSYIYICVRVFMSVLILQQSSTTYLYIYIQSTLTIVYVHVWDSLEGLNLRVPNASLILSFLGFLGVSFLVHTECGTWKVTALRESLFAYHKLEKVNAFFKNQILSIIINFSEEILIWSNPNLFSELQKRQSLKRGG